MSNNYLTTFSLSLTRHLNNRNGSVIIMYFFFLVQFCFIDQYMFWIIVLSVLFQWHSKENKIFESLDLWMHREQSKFKEVIYFHLRTKFDHIVFFYVASPFRKWVLIALHNFLYFVIFFYLLPSFFVPVLLDYICSLHISIRYQQVMTNSFARNY